MSASTPPKREPTHRSDGGRYRKHYVFIGLGGVVFALAWLVWTFWLSSAVPK